MCLALPAKVIAIDEASETATVALSGVRKRVSIALVDSVALGDYLLIHVGHALNKISAAEAERTLALMVEAGLIPAGDEGAGEGSALA
ncbi:MAG: HypC/HybG/HupF family hydrogenase formation chaperone [Kiloniellales bacterium]|nr:HypC/HybG/HupF family hydrogenase formation chaperone [Kiloniellales bacterium]